jgi:hypothetical protein
MTKEKETNSTGTRANLRIENPLRTIVVALVKESK